MKKYIITLAVLAFAISGCTKQPELTGDTTGSQDKGQTEEEILKAEESGTAGDDADATDPANTGGDKE